MNLYRSAVDRAINGKRGQKFLRELANTMDAMPIKRLITGDLINSSNECCTIGVVCKYRKIDVSDIDCEDPEEVGAAVGISRSMAAEIEYENDENYHSINETPEDRWKRMRAWVSSNLNEPPQEK